MHIKIPDFFEIVIPDEQGDARTSALVNLRWVLTCWASAINERYIEGSPRRVETHQKIESLFAQMWTHLNEDERYEYGNNLVDAETGKAIEFQ